MLGYHFHTKLIIMHEGHGRTPQVPRQSEGKEQWLTA